MKIQCNVCGTAEAAVLCCADEAALCRGCDQKVHAANKLAGKHQRVPLTNSSSQMPKCDICQETFGYFFCLEDRALLCRKCDVSIHTANSLVSVHRRFLLTGVKVGLEATEPSPSLSSGNAQSTEKSLEVEPRPIPNRINPVSTNSQPCKSVVPVEDSVGGDFSSPKLPFAGDSFSGGVSQWQLDEFSGLGDFTQNFNFMDNVPSKANTGKLGVSDYSQFLNAAEGELEGDEQLSNNGQVPDTFWAVPQLTSPPPTAASSGLYWPKNYQNPTESDSTFFVPDLISSSPMQNFTHHHQPHVTSSKRRRDF